jgi:hypothetical protein
MIDLMKFCAPDSIHRAIQCPFSLGDWTYSTDGHILVRVPRRVAILPNVDNNFMVRFRRKFLPTFEAVIAERTFAPLPDHEFVPGHPAEPCTDHDPDECYNCGDTGFAVSKGPDICRYRTHQFDAKYIDLIRGLPGLAVAFGPKAADRWGNRDTDLSLAFRWEGGEGQVMPIYWERP